MHGYYLFTILVVLTTVFSYINSRFFKLPVSIAVTVFSLVVSSVLLLLYNALPELNRLIRNNLQSIPFSEIVIDILLGFLLFAAALKIDSIQFKKHLPVIISMALFATLLSTFISGSLLYFSVQLFSVKFSFVNCLLFGAIISPTDPVAVLAVLRKVGIAKKLQIQITGESIINDGIAIVIFLTLLNISTSGETDNIAWKTALLFLREAGGALLFGLPVGILAYYLLKWTSNFKIEILVTLSIVMGGYTLARLIEVSAPIAMVVTGLVCSAGNNGEHSNLSKEFVITFWEMIEDLINVILFLLIGITVFVIPFKTVTVLLGLITIPELLLARYISLLPVYALVHKRLEKNSIKLFTWGALRGAISIALALSLPPSLHRSEFLTITYIVALFSIIVQGLTLPALVKKWRLGSG